MSIPCISTSYIYSSFDTYLYPHDSNLYSVPSIEIKDNKFILTLNSEYQPALFCNGSLVSSLEDFLKKVFSKLNLESFANNKMINSKILEKIATLTNYLCFGYEYSLIPSSAELKNSKQESNTFSWERKKLIFYVTKEGSKYKVQISCLCGQAKVYYKLINDDQKA